MTMQNDQTTYQIRVADDLLESYKRAAKARDKSAAGEVRDFMRRYVAEHGQTDWVEEIKKK
jgi:hypothetical protein